MKRITTIAVYLPQYHRIPENDEWWGEGFTDWVAVRNAEAYFEGHNQPREPLNDNYYDLEQKETMQWQADLAKKYDVGGFCFYHYYFKDGRKILEKPAENLLKWKDIDMPFCFCWANDTWARSWSKLEHTNSWAEKFEQKEKKEKTILLEQAYGGEDEWRKHFEYLYPFFRDERYIKVNGHPLFVIYHPEDIAALGDMISCWNQWMAERGQEELYVLGANCARLLPGLNGILFVHAAAYLMPKLIGQGAEPERKNGVNVYDYEDAWDNAIRTEPVKGARTYVSGFVDADETPRRGRLAFCLGNVSPEAFERNLYDLAVKNQAMGNELLFIDAWNEWGEGDYLEPDKTNGYRYLEAVKAVMARCNAPGLDIGKEWEIIRKKRNIQDKDTGKDVLLGEAMRRNAYCRVYDKWMTMLEEQNSLKEYFIRQGIYSVIIYGYMALGRHLYTQLKDTEIRVIAVMDRRSEITHETLPVYSLEDELPECDAIVVTPVYDFGEIAAELKKKTKARIISLEQAVFGD